MVTESQSAHYYRDSGCMLILLRGYGTLASHGVAYPTLGRWTQKGQEFKAIVCYTTSLMPAWAVGNGLKKER